jgi:catechol 2,3-dioxygenase-like lactoylglutathione lyase family enzyme
MARGTTRELVAVIGGVTKVVVEVEDQDRALGFWTEQLGFELVTDAPYGEERWQEVRTPDKAVTLVPELRRGERPTAPDPGLPTSNVFFYAEDLQQTYQELTARGVQSPSRPSSSRSAGGRCSPTPKATGSPWSPRPVGGGD